MVTFEEMRSSMAARAAARSARVQRLQVRLEASLPRVAEGLQARGARRVWLFGSLAEGRLGEDSDVDLAVEGLSDAELFRAAAWCAEALDHHVDLVRLEDAPPSLRDRVLAAGRQLK